MSNRLTITNVNLESNRIEVYYKAEGIIAEYLNEEEKCFWAEYTECIESVPKSIAVIPFVCNVLPIVWVTDAELVIPELDNTFYESTFDIKHGYMLLIPQMQFLGKIQVGSLVDNHYETSNETSVLFSGGVDAFATLFAHLNEKPHMVTLRGADIKLTDTEGWNVVSNHVEEVAKTFDLPNPSFVTTNFRLFLKEGKLSSFTRVVNDGWWHAIQHGIGIISHTAPLAYIHKYKCIYIASSYTVDHVVCCASDPAIDSQVRIASTFVKHDRYCMNRSQKVKLIIDTCSKLEKQIKLRVCWITEGGNNCCVCEKCIRTIFNILSEGGNPNDYGFEKYENYCNKYNGTIKETLYDTTFLRPVWQEIKDTFEQNRTIIPAATDTRFNWIYNFDIYAERPLTQRIKRLLARIINKLKKIFL